MKKNKGYKIDFATNTLYMNYKFAAAAENPNSKEYEIVLKILKDIPTIKLVKQAGRKHTTNANKRLTYANMERYIRVQSNADELMAAFAIAKEESKCEPSPYSFVRNWFVAQFPNYKENKVFDMDKVINFAEPAIQEENAS